MKTKIERESILERVLPFIRALAVQSCKKYAVDETLLDDVIQTATLTVWDATKDVDEGIGPELFMALNLKNLCSWVDNAAAVEAKNQIAVSLSSMIEDEEACYGEW